MKLPTSLTLTAKAAAHPAVTVVVIVARAGVDPEAGAAETVVDAVVARAGNRHVVCVNRGRAKMLSRFFDKQERYQARWPVCSTALHNPTANRSLRLLEFMRSRFVIMIPQASVSVGANSTIRKNS
jgi:hypothetical protein